MVEIERKFVVRELPIAEDVSGTSMIQGYLPAQRGMSVRVRVTPDGAFLVVKGPRQGSARLQVEQALEPAMADHLLHACGSHVVSKTRYPLLANGQLWVIDVFQDENEGLVLAEVELTSTSTPVTVPGWCGPEVTEDVRYYNEYLAERPFQTWGTEG